MERQQNDKAEKSALDFHFIILEKKIEAIRLNVLINQISLLFSRSVTPFRELIKSKQENALERCIIITELDCVEDVERLFELAGTSMPAGVTVVSTKWLSDCIRAKAMVEPEMHYCLKRKQLPVSTLQKPDESASTSDSASSASAQQPEYLCQMLCPLEHHNFKLTTALSTLARNAEHQFGITKDQQYYAKALAFDRAAACLKTLPRPLKSINQLIDSCPRYLGDHAIRIISEMLSTGSCLEVDNLTCSDLYKSMTSLTSIYGVGQSLAYKWYSQGVRTPEQAAQRLLLIERRNRGDLPELTGEEAVSLDLGVGDHKRLHTGLAFHSDLAKQAVTKIEAEHIRHLVDKLLAYLRGPGYLVTLVGGFSRGKSVGHDCDLLISHETEGRELGAVADVAKALASRGLVLHGTYETNSFSPSVLSRDFRVKELRSTLDHFEKWLGVLKLSNSISDDSGTDFAIVDDAAELPAKRKSVSPDYCTFSSFTEAMSMATDERNWLARRVDLIAVPKSQLAYALLGWTGNRLFNRDLRLFAQRQRRMKLTSHGLFDLQKEVSLPAENEEEIFRHLGLEYIPPQFRNC